MSQEMVLPLALAYAREYPDNKYYQTERLKELSEAAIRYMIKSSHKDGTCDDYFPYERAMGALGKQEKWRLFSLPQSNKRQEQLS